MKKNPRQGSISIPLWIQLSAISLGFASLYPIARSLPDTKCVFLHYDNLGQTAEGDDLCGQAEATFFDLDRLSFPVIAKLDQMGEAKAGEEAFFNLSLTTLSGRPLAPKDLAVVHTKKMHMLVTDPSLEDYHHIHPEPIGEGGQYTFSFTPKAGGEYHAYVEVVPSASRSAVISRLKFDVGGESQQQTTQETREVTIGDYVFSLEFSDKPQTVVPNDLRLTIRNKDSGQEVQLEKIMGAYCHMVAFDEGRRGFAHMHPLDEGLGVNSGHPDFGFNLTTTIPGYYKVYAQVQIDGQEIFAPFDVIVQ